MARGRFLSKSLSDSPDFNLELSSDFSRLLWMMLVTHLDVEGRFWAEPRLVSAKVLPWRADVTLDQVEASLQEYEDLDFIIRYKDSKGLRVLQAVKFAKYQQGLRKDRELASVFPAPPPELFPACSDEMPDNSADDDEAEAESLRNDSGVTPEAIPLKLKAKAKAKFKSKHKHKPPPAAAALQKELEEQAASIRPPPAAAAAALRKALEHCGIRGQKLAALLGDTWITPERVAACQRAVSERESVRNPVGLLVAMLEAHDEPSVPKPKPEDDPYRYITGEYGQYILH